MRIHVGSGFVYLTPSVLTDPAGWLNVECREADAMLAPHRPDLVERYSTTDDAYYARFEAVDKAVLSAGPKPQAALPVCDAYGYAEQLPVADGQAAEVLARQVFEHFSVREARRALIEFHRVLRCGGVLRLDVPDHDGTVAKIRAEQDPFWVRHLLGTKRNDVAYHVMSYTRDTLVGLVREYGFDYAGEEPNVHFYPAFCLRFTKPPVDRNPWDYNFAMAGTAALPGPALDVGCGPTPWPGATAIVDVDQRYLAGHPNAVRATVERLPFKAKAFNFAYASHVLEHVERPQHAAAELSRVAAAGLVECPSVYKEALFNFHEADHKWHVWPPAGPGQPLRFQPIDQAWVAKLRSADLQGVAHRLYRLGPPRLEHDSIVARRWYQQVEPHLNVVHAWQGALSVIVEQWAGSNA